MTDFFFFYWMEIFPEPFYLFSLSKQKSVAVFFQPAEALILTGARKPGSTTKQPQFKLLPSSRVGFVTSLN